MTCEVLGHPAIQYSLQEPQILVEQRVVDGHAKALRNLLIGFRAEPPQHPNRLKVLVHDREPEERHLLVAGLVDIEPASGQTEWFDVAALDRLRGLEVPTIEELRCPVLCTRAT